MGRANRPTKPQMATPAGRRGLKLLFAIAGLAVLFATAGAPGMAARADDAKVRALFAAINDERAQNDAAILKTDPALQIAAQRLAELHVEAGRTRQPKPDACEEIERMGLDCNGLFKVATRTSLEPAIVADLLFEKPDLRAELTARGFTVIGIGHATHTDREGGGQWMILMADPPEPAPRDWQERLLGLVNAFREEYDLPALSPQPLLDEMAQRHADDMAYGDYMAHRNPNGKGPGERADAVGYAWARILENLATGQETPEAVIEGWKRSPAHRKAMLNNEVTEAGLGYRFLARDPGEVRSYHYWTLVLGRPQ